MKTPAINRVLKKKLSKKVKKKGPVKKATKKARIKAVMVSHRGKNPITRSESGAITITGNEIDLFSLLSQRAALKLEILGMKRRGPSVASILKRQYGWKGSKEKLLAMLETEIARRKAEMDTSGKHNRAENPAPSKHGRPFVRKERKIFDEYDFSIAGHFLPALINGDTSGLDDNEKHQLNRLVTRLPPGGHWDVPKDEFGNDQEGHFAEDDVTGLRANVYDVTYYAPKTHWVEARRNNPNDDENIYVQNGYKNRRDYLESLAEEYDVPLKNVLMMAQLLGPSEDFDGLIVHLEDDYDGRWDNPIKRKGPENLDAMEPDELMAFWKRHQRGRGSRELVGVGRGTKTVTNALANYAANIATAKKLRLAGDVAGALKYERIAEKIYRELPPNVRW